MTTPVGLELVWANGGGSSDPGNAKYQLGWVSEIPTFQNFNFVLQNLDKTKLSFAEADIYGWNDKIEYVAGARVKNAGVVWICINTNTNQEPSNDTTSSYWVTGTVFSRATDAFANLTAQDGVKIDQVNSRTNNAVWEGNDITITNNNAVVAMNTTGVEDNFLFGNINGKIVVVNVGNTVAPDSTTKLTPSENENSFEVYHEGHKPTQSEVDGTIPTNPANGILYGRRNGNWERVSAVSASKAPPPPVEGAGSGWYNLEDGTLYVDIYDGDSSQWVPASPPNVTASVEDVDRNTKNVSILKTQVSALQLGQDSGVIGYATRAELFADKAYPDKTVGYVTNDTTPAYNGTYRKLGDSGTGSWVQASGDLASQAYQKATSNETTLNETVDGYRAVPRPNLVAETGSVPALSWTSPDKLPLAVSVDGNDTYHFTDTGSTGYIVTKEQLSGITTLQVGVTVYYKSSNPLSSYLTLYAIQYRSDNTEISGSRLTISIDKSEIITPKTFTDSIAVDIDTSYVEVKFDGRGTNHDAYLGRIFATGDTVQPFYRDPVNPNLTSLSTQLAETKPKTDTILVSTSNLAWQVVDSKGDIAIGVSNEGVLKVATLETEEYSPEKIVLKKVNNVNASTLKLPIGEGYYTSEVNHFLSYGQSLSLGIGSTAASLTQNKNSVTFNSTATAFVPLTESAYGAESGAESICSSMSDTVCDIIEDENGIAYTGHNYKMLASCAGEGGYGIDGLLKGGTIYPRIVSQLSEGKAAANADGDMYAMQAVAWMQGESDYNNNTPLQVYVDKLTQLRLDIDTDAKTETSQDNDVPLITYQVASHIARPNGVYPTIALAQLKAIEDNPLIYGACPAYIFSYNGDNVHMPADSYVKIAKYFGLAYKRIVVDKVSHDILRPLSYKADGNRVYITLNTPRPPLVFDTSIVAKNENFGFTVKDISDVEILQTEEPVVINNNTVKLTLAQPAQVGDKIQYAFYDTVGGGATGRTDGARGNLRDSQGDDISVGGYRLDNYCFIFEGIL